MHGVTPFLWFDSDAQEAAEFYASVIPDTTWRIAVQGESAPVVVTCTIKGMEFAFLNGGPHYTKSPAFSICLRCDDQAEIDRLWEALLDGGSALYCGWLTDKFGVTWQVTPQIFFDLYDRGTPAQHDAIMKALGDMQKLEIAPIIAAFEAAAT
jgi:predicted 3-demethylubiquinone-9 3-methyltransferase (glyoxalase superfamily)